MPNDAYTDAIKEAFALAPLTVVYLDTLEFSCEGLDSLWLVKDRASHLLTLETGVQQLFDATPFRFNLPAVSDNGVQELSIAVDNVDGRPAEFAKGILATGKPVSIIYRPYLASDPTTPQMNPPLVMTLRDITITALQVTGRASVHDVLNRAFPTEYYVRRRFVSLGDS
jgi:hypothetical protein